MVVILSPQPDLGQDPATATDSAAAGSGLAGWLAELAQRPGLLETLLAGLVVGVGLLIWLRLLRVVDNVRNRQAIKDYLLGVEQALAGDLAGAHKRLARVLEADPENHYARLLFGKVLAGRGEPAQAHKHHLYLQRAFAIESVENDLQLANALASVGRPVEAADAAERAIRAEPGHVLAVEFVFRMRLQAGDHEAAASVGRRLMALADKADSALRADVARAFSEVGQQRLHRGDLGGARSALSEARRLADQTPEVRLFEARVDAARDGAAAVARRLLASQADGQEPQLPMPVGQQSLVPAETVKSALPALAPLLPEGRWRCNACGAGLVGAVARCPRCGAEGRAEVDEPALFVTVATPGYLVDAMEQNAAHVRRTVKSALQAEDNSQRADARAVVLDLADKAVAELLAHACARHRATAQAAVELLQQLGPATTPTLLAAAEALEDQRVLPLVGSQIAAVTGRVLQGFDREALTHVEALFASARPSSRKILIDYFLGLGDPVEFQVVLERFPPLEILHRLNKSDEPVLVRFVQAIPPEHFVAEVLLLEPTFYRDESVLAAISGAKHPEVLEQVLLHRGPSQTLTEALLAAVGDAELRAVALRLLHSFGVRVLDHVLAAFVDRDRDAALRAHLARLLAGFGPAAVERLCRSFGPEPTSLDD